MTWKRRYFVLDKNCVMTQYKADITSSKKAKYTSSFNVTGFSDMVGSDIKLPKQFDASFGIILSTSNPKSPQRIVMASSIQEKRLWMNSLASCLRKEANFDISSIVELGVVVDKNKELEVILSSCQEDCGIVSNNDPTCLSISTRLLIAAYVGNLVDVGRLSLVSKAWHSVLRFPKQKCSRNSIHCWLVRYGTGFSVDINRWFFWKFLIVKKAVSRDSFESYGEAVSSFVKFEIKKDVDRAFGVTDKRMCQRRTISMRGSHGASFSMEDVTEAFSSDDEDEESQRPILASELSIHKNLMDSDIVTKKECLTNILQSLAGRFPSVGYCQGIDRVVVHVMRASRTAVSLASLTQEERSHRKTVNLSKEVECFSFLESFFETLQLPDVYSRDGVSGLRLRMWQLARLFEYHCPSLYKVLESEGMTLDVFCIGWVQTLFLYIEAMPAKTIDRIWDILIFEASWVIIFQVSVALVKMSSKSLIDSDLDEIVLYLNNFPDPSILEPEILLAEASKIHLTEEILERLKSEYNTINK